MAIDYALLDGSSAAAGGSIVAVGIAFLGTERADVRQLPRKARSVLLQPGCESFVSGVGSSRYCLYSATPKRLYRAEIHHLPWALQAAAAQTEENSMTKTLGLELPAEADAMQFSRSLKVLVWAPERLI